MAPLPGVFAFKGGVSRFTLIKDLMKDESGATAIEYGLIAALVSVAAIAALQALGGSLQNMFNTVATALDDAQPAPVVP